MTPATFLQAGLLPGENLRSLDAVHLASAIAAGVDLLVTYDERMSESARDVGLVMMAPGRDDQPVNVDERE